MIFINLNIVDQASEPLRAKIKTLSPARLPKIIGPRLSELTRDRLAKNPANKNGWPSTGFWEAAARATAWKDDGDGTLTISINQIGVRQRYYGGAITPKSAKALAIPISPVSYGHTPKDFPGLFLIVTPKGAYLVQSGESVSEKTGRIVGLKKAGGNGRRRQRAALNFLFKLSAGVNQAANKAVIPSPEEYTRAALAALQTALVKNVTGGGNG